MTPSELYDAVVSRLTKQLGADVVSANHLFISVDDNVVGCARKPVLDRTRRVDLSVCVGYGNVDWVRAVGCETTEQALSQFESDMLPRIRSLCGLPEQCKEFDPVRMGC